MSANLVVARKQAKNGEFLDVIGLDITHLDKIYNVTCTIIQSITVCSRYLQDAALLANALQARHVSSLPRCD